MADKRKLYRSINDDYLIAGVCSGLGEYLDIDTTLIRVIFVLLALTGSGILIYLVLWLIVPKKGEKMANKKVAELSKKIKNKDLCNRRGSFFGVLLVVIGGAFLLEKLVPMVIDWEYVFPGLLVFLGLYLIFRK